MATIKEGIGKFSLAGTIDFDQDGNLDIPVLTRDTAISMPTVSFNPEYNPFDTTPKSEPSRSSSSVPSMGKQTTIIPKSWETLYDGFENERTAPADDLMPDTEAASQQLEVFASSISDDEDQQMQISYQQKEHGDSPDRFFQLKHKYILTSVRSGLMIVDQQRAHRRIMFEKYIGFQEGKRGITQKILFPETIELNAEDSLVLEGILDEVRFLGFDIDLFGKQAFVVNGVPADIVNGVVTGIIEEMIEVARETGRNSTEKVREKLALALAKSVAVKYGDFLSGSEMQDLVDRLFACETPNYDPEGKPTLNIIDMNELTNRLN